MAEVKMGDEERCKILSQLSEFLIPSKDYVKTGNEIAQEIIKICQGMANYKNCRPSIGGSIGKKTALPDEFEPDFDIIITFNKTLGLEIDPVQEKMLDLKEIKTKFNEVVLAMEKAIRAKLANNNLFKILPKSHGHDGKIPSRICLKLKIEKNGREYSFDILPAHNFHPVVGKGEKPAELHLKKAIDNITYIFNNEANLFKKVGNFYSSAFSEAALEFVKKQSALTHQNIRLAKFWLNQVIRAHIKKDVFGLTFLVELIAIHTVKSQEIKNSKSVSGFKVFIQFLMLMNDFENIRIVFTDYYDNTKVPKVILESRPLVLDPANPTNNVAALIPEETIEILSEQAKQTQSQIENNFDCFAKKIPAFFLQLFFQRTD